MDPVSHALFAKTLHALDDRARLGRGAAAAFVAGGLLPDVDVVRVVQGWDVYLFHHEAGTHTVWAAPVLGALLAMLLRVLVRDARFLPLYLASTLGALSHVFLDFAGGSDMRIFVPVDDVKAGWHLMAMWEPYVVLGLLALHLPRWKRRARLSLIFLAVFATFLGTKAVSQELTRGEHLVELGEPARLEEVRGSFTRWRWFQRTESGYAVYDVRATGEAPRRRFAHSFGESNASLAVASRPYPVVRHLLHLGEMPLVWIETVGSRHEVHWSDMQFCGRSRCAMSFGVVFDATGTAVGQFVDVGGLRQTRPAVVQEGFVLSRIE